jgi:hypothetical protein
MNLALCNFSTMSCLEALAMDLTNMEQALSLLNFKLEAIKQYGNRKAHLLYLHKLESINKPETSKASQCLLQLKKQEFEIYK